MLLLVKFYMERVNIKIVFLKFVSGKDLDLKGVEKLKLDEKWDFLNLF